MAAGFAVLILGGPCQFDPECADGRFRRDSAVSSASRGRLFLPIPAISQRCPNAPGGWLRSFDLRAVMQGVYGRQLRASCFVGLSRASTKIDWNS
jgi:hypothetical protein